MGSRLHGSHLARRTTVQPVQLSLLPDQVPPPPATLIAVLPERQVAAAVTLLADLIARTANPTPGGPAAGMEAGGE
jgi:hypothetical protein